MKSANIVVTFALFTGVFVLKQETREWWQKQKDREMLNNEGNLKNESTIHFPGSSPNLQTCCMEQELVRVSVGNKKRRRFVLREHPVIILPQDTSWEKWMFSTPNITQAGFLARTHSDTRWQRLTAAFQWDKDKNKKIDSSGRMWGGTIRAEKDAESEVDDQTGFYHVTHEEFFVNNNSR